MGIYIKNANSSIKNQEKDYSYPQMQLLKTLGEIWNNQDNLTSKDLTKLKDLSQKNYFDD